MAPFFSVVMPVCNSERYLKRAIDSVVGQTFGDFELIIIDDGSKDGSLKLCQEYAEADSRVRVFHEEDNVFGVSGARNVALGRATGQYVAFVDSDDVVESNLLDIGHTYLAGGEIDFLKYSCVEEYYDEAGNLAYSRERNMPDELVEAKDLPDKAVEMECIPLFGYVWNGLYRRKMILDNGIEFNTAYRVNEDFDFNIQYLKHCNNMQCIGEKLYHYAKRGNDSLSSKQNSVYYELHMMKVRAFVGLYDSVDGIRADTRVRVFWLYTRFVYSSLQRVMGKNRKELLKKIKQDKLFDMFLATKFIGHASTKQVVLTSLLKSCDFLLLSAVNLIDFVRVRFPILFAKWKE